MTDCYVCKWPILEGQPKVSFGTTSRDWPHVLWQHHNPGDCKPTRLLGQDIKETESARAILDDLLNHTHGPAPVETSE